MRTLALLGLRERRKRIGEAVAVTLRDGGGEPVHGGLFHLSPDGVVEKLVLIDSERGIDTDADSAWTAFGLTMTVGKLLVKNDNGTHEMEWSIIDLMASAPCADIPAPTPARLAVRDAYANEILPALGATARTMQEPQT